MAVPFVSHRILWCTWQWEFSPFQHDFPSPRTLLPWIHRPIMPSLFAAFINIHEALPCKPFRPSHGGGATIKLSCQSPSIENAVMSTCLYARSVFYRWIHTWNVYSLALKGNATSTDNQDSGLGVKSNNLMPLILSLRESTAVHFSFSLLWSRTESCLIGFSPGSYKKELLIQCRTT